MRTRTGRCCGSASNSVPAPIEPDQSVPVTTVPIPCDREGAIDEQPRCAQQRPVLDSAAGSDLVPARPATRRQAGTRPVRSSRSPGAPGTSSRASSRIASSSSLFLSRVGFRHRRPRRCSIAEEPEDREMLVRLWPGALVGVDDRAGTGRRPWPRRPCCARTARGPGTSMTESSLSARARVSGA